jgi:hypothetical protein
MFKIFFRKLYSLRGNYIEEGRLQMTVWYVHIACWITKATNTVAEYVILIASPLQQLLYECVPVCRYTHIACLILRPSVPLYAHCLSYFTYSPTNALTYVNTILCTLLHSYTFHPSRGHPQEVLIHFVSMVNKMRVQM